MAARVKISIEEDGGGSLNYDLDASSVDVAMEYEGFEHPWSAVYPQPMWTNLRFTVVNPRVVKEVREEPTSWKYEGGDLVETKWGSVGTITGRFLTDGVQRYSVDTGEYTEYMNESNLTLIKAHKPVPTPTPRRRWGNEDGQTWD